MTQDEIVAMAKKAGAAIGKPTPTAPEIIFTQSLDIMSFAKLVAAHERERCCAIIYSQCDSDNVAQRTVDAIRGQQ